VSTGRSEDEAWRSIVDNFGDRARLDDEPPEPPDDAAVDAGVDAGVDDARPVPGPVVAAGTAAAGPWDEEPAERFVPPVPPPAPRLPMPQRLAWLAVLGSPALLVVALLVSYDLPSLVGYALVAGFLGGFGYLVATMQRAGERNPWDDGAQL